MRTETTLPIRVGLIVAGVCLALAPTASAAGGTACFDWSCPRQLPPVTCSFDASCSVPESGAYIWKYSWDFGDGSTSGLLGSPTTSHAYGSGYSQAYVTLTVYQWGGSGNPLTVSCAISVYWPGGPPVDFSGRCSN